LNVVIINLFLIYWNKITPIIDKNDAAIINAAKSILENPKFDLPYTITILVIVD
jgi:hypothetical protein